MTKRALLIGINYFGTDSELSGCINDIINVQGMLVNHGYAEFTMLRDDDHASTPTRDRILIEIARSIKSLTSGDTLYIHYSGHGSYIKDTSHDEIDGRDECICPSDYATAGFITDDELHNAIFIRDIPKCSLRVVFDSCHSGSAIDTPLRYSGYKLTRENNVTPLDIKGNIVDCVFLSGCLDSQTSADAYIVGKYSGALTYAWLQVLNDVAGATHSYTWRDICVAVQLWLKKHQYEQIPQLGLCSKNKLTEAFSL